MQRIGVRWTRAVRHRKLGERTSGIKLFFRYVTSWMDRERRYHRATERARFRETPDIFLPECRRVITVIRYILKRELLLSLRPDACTLPCAHRKKKKKKVREEEKRRTRKKENGERLIGGRERIYVNWPSRRVRRRCSLINVHPPDRRHRPIETWNCVSVASAPDTFSLTLLRPEQWSSRSEFPSRRRRLIKRILLSIYDLRI